MIPTFDFITALKFASHAMATYDPRDYLNGVLFRAVGGQLLLVGTDGHRIAQVRLNSDAGCPPGDWIVKADSVKDVLAALKPKKTANTEVHLEAAHGDLLLSAGAVRLTLEVCDGRYPDLERALARGKPDGVPCLGLNAKYLAEAARALAPLANGKYRGVTFEAWSKPLAPVRLSAATNHGAFVAITEPATVHLMPMRL